MGRPKGRTKAKDGPGEGPSERITIISLKGTRAQAEWLEVAHRQTHIAKAVIVRLALDLWSAQQGLPHFPFGDDE